jgi:predicted RNase H-like nuclease (RuvC/YqgF family)
MDKTKEELEFKERLAEIIRNGITFSPQIGTFMIHEVLDKAYEFFQSELSTIKQENERLTKGFTETGKYITSLVEQNESLKREVEDLNSQNEAWIETNQINLKMYNEEISDLKREVREFAEQESEILNKYLNIETPSGTHECVALDVRETWYGLGYSKTDDGCMLVFKEKESIGGVVNIIDLKPEFVILLNNPSGLIGIKAEIERILKENNIK